MGWGKSIRKTVSKIRGVTDWVLPGISQTLGYASDAATHNSAVTQKAKEDREAINAAETAAKNAADADYYDQIMKSRRRQIADAARSKTNFTTEDGALGAFDDNVPGAFDPVSGAFGKKKKVNA